MAFGCEDTADDARLVEAARAGDRDAFAALLSRHAPLVRRLCARVLGDRWRADDALQEAAVAALLDLGRLRDPGRFGPWMAGIGLNVCRQWLRAAQRDQHARRRGDAGAEPADPADVAAEREVARRVRGAVGALPPGQRRAVALFYFQGMTVAEMAAALDIDVNAGKARLHKARASLRRRLADTWEERPMQPVHSASPVRMDPVDVVRVPAGGEPGDRPEAHALVLRERDGERRLAIWVGQPEATWLALELEQVELPRPGPYAAMQRLLEATGAALTEARIARLEASVFYATVVVDGPAGRREVDMRPSDALNLAVRAGVPIMVDDVVISDAQRARGWDADTSETDAQALHRAQLAAEAVQRWERSMAWSEQTHAAGS